MKVLLKSVGLGHTATVMQGPGILFTVNYTADGKDQGLEVYEHYSNAFDSADKYCGLYSVRESATMLG